MLYFIMQVSSNTLLNILLPNNNKTLKNVLKDADSKTLEQMIKNKTSSPGEVLKNLFEQVKSGDKSNTTIETLLKNSIVFKDMGSFSKSLNTILKQIDSNPKLEQFKASLESFSKDIKNIDANSLKEQLSKSGVFLESKIAQSASGETSITKNLSKTLDQIQTLVKNITTPESKQINELVSKILDPKTNDTNEKMQNIKTLIPLLNTIKESLGNKNTQNLSNLTNELKNLIDKGSLIESKIQNTANKVDISNTKNISPTLIKENILQSPKEILTDLRKELALDNKQGQNNTLIAKLDTVLKSNDLFTKKENIPLMKNILNNIADSNEMTDTQKTNPKTSALIENLKTSLNENTKMQNISQSNIPTTNKQSNEIIKEQVQTQTKQVLTQLKSELLTTNSNSNETKSIVQKIDNLLKSNDLFIQDTKQIDTKSLINNLSNSKELTLASKTNPTVSNIVLNLKNIVDEISTLENKALNLTNVLKEKLDLTTSLKENLSNLKTELSNMKNIDSKEINQIISKLQNNQDIFSKVDIPNKLEQNIQNNNTNIFKNNFSSNLNTLLISLKENISNTASNPNNANVQNQIFNTIDKIETIIKENVQVQNQNLTNPNLAKVDINQNSSDMKSVLLQMSEELSSKTDVKSQELFKQVEKMLVQIDYHQLLSLSTNSNYVYIPFFWDMLEDGTINMKKVDEDKFYCQINLTLKDFGKVDLMLSLYDKNKLDLNIHAQREHFKTVVKDNLQNLKKSLNNVGLIPMNIKLLDLEEDKTEEIKKTEVYTNPYNQDLDSGLDIRV